MAGIMDAISHASAHGGGTVSFAVGSNKDGALKVVKFGWTPRTAGSAPPKLQLGGSWPANFDVRELVIDLEGMIVGSSPSAYWTARAALMQSVLPPASRTRSTKHHGTLTITPPGQSAASILVNLIDYDIPLAAASGRSSDYRLSWTGVGGYWTRSGSPVTNL